MNRSIALIAVLVLLAGGAYLAMNRDSDVTPTETLSETSTSTNTNGTTSPADTQTGQSGTSAGIDVSAGVNSGSAVRYTADGFSPKTITIRRGQSVTWVNESGERLWIASDPHPQHTDYSGTARAEHCATTRMDSFDACAAAEIYTFIFNKAGTWRYHNHAAANDVGTVIVTE